MPHILTALQEELAQKWSNADWTETEILDHCQSVSREKLIVVGGCARSGTTLARVILDSHHNVMVGPPTNVFIPVPLSPRDLAFRLDLDVKWVIQAVENAEDRVRFIEMLVSKCRKTYEKSIFGEKTARNVHRFDWILRHFPESRIIHVIRDGRDVVSSLRRHRRRQVVEGSIIPLMNEMPLELCVDRWARSIKDGLMHRGDSRYYEIRYEELVEKPEEAVSALCDFLDLPFENQMLAFHEIGGPLRDPIRFPQNVEATFPLRAVSIGRWRTDLNEKELRFVEKELAGPLSILGYLPR